MLLRLSNGPERPEVVTLPRHKKHPPAGVKASTRSRVRSPFATINSVSRRPAAAAWSRGRPTSAQCTRVRLFCSDLAC